MFIKKTNSLEQEGMEGATQRTLLWPGPFASHRPPKPGSKFGMPIHFSIPSPGLFATAISALQDTVSAPGRAYRQHTATIKTDGNDSDEQVSKRGIRVGIGIRRTEASFRSRPSETNFKWFH